MRVDGLGYDKGFVVSEITCRGVEVSVGSVDTKKCPWQTDLSCGSVRKVEMDLTMCERHL